MPNGPRDETEPTTASVPSVMGRLDLRPIRAPESLSSSRTPGGARNHQLHHPPERRSIQPGQIWLPSFWQSHGGK
jgi:hypothetical protein